MQKMLCSHPQPCIWGSCLPEYCSLLLTLISESSILIIQVSTLGRDALSSFLGSLLNPNLFQKKTSLKFIFFLVLTTLWIKLTFFLFMRETVNCLNLGTYPTSFSSWLYIHSQNRNILNVLVIISLLNK